MAAAADTELRRRHPSQHFAPLRSAESEPATETQCADLTRTGQTGEIAQWIKELAAAQRVFNERLADRQSVKIPSSDPDYGDLGRAFPQWAGQGRDAISQPPKPEIRPSPYVLESGQDHDTDWEAGD